MAMKNTIITLIIALMLVVFTKTTVFSASDDSAACDSISVAYNLKLKGSSPSRDYYANRQVWVGSRGGYFVLVKHKETGCYVKRYISVFKNI